MNRTQLEGHFPSGPSRTLYFDLVDGGFSDDERQSAADFLRDQLGQAEHLPCDLPCETSGLVGWMERGVEEVGARYHAYLEERKSGAGPRYFPTKSSALHFLKGVAPTKLVDGAWLYGLLPHWTDARFGALITTYLEELGEGLPSKNHVTLYKKLMAVQGIDRFDDLSEDHFVQGAIQLALAYNADEFLPEIIGFNLGYEQLPLHLLITAYELKEWKIDPYYFTLHVTVDNSDTGHARKAVDSISQTMPRLSDPQEWIRRVRNGYNLNFLGASTGSVIESFDLEGELIAILQRKGAVGQYAHSDYRRFEGRTVNEWLADPASTAEFLRVMERTGWFLRHQDPENSRFWKLIEGEGAKMFGVFSAFERQVIWDWIAGDAVNSPELRKKALQSEAKLSFADKQRLREGADAESETSSEFDAEVVALQRHLATATDQDQAMKRLIELMSPALHHSAPGLMATRIFNDVLN